MSDQLTIKIPESIRKIFKEWALDFKAVSQRFDSPVIMELSNRLSSYATVVSTTPLPWSFIKELFDIAAGHISQDYESVVNKKHKKRLLNLQRGSKEVGAWLGEILQISDIYTFNAKGEMFVVCE